MMAALFPSERGLAQDIRTFQPDPQCRPRMAPSSALDASALAAGRGDLFVRLRSWEDALGIEGGRVELSPLDGVPAARPDSQATDSNALGLRWRSGGVYPFANRPAGRYLMTARRIGYAAAPDTVLFRAGAADTMVITMEPFLDDWANVHNCRPHHFRSPGESACLTDTAFTGNLRDYAIRLAKSPSDQRALKLPPFTRGDVKVIHDEAICEKAATA
jgi:hypothetical protein